MSTVRWISIVGIAIVGGGTCLAPPHAAAAPMWANAEDAKALPKSSIDLLHAVAIAEDKAFPTRKPGDRALAARFNGSANRFLVTLVTGNKVEDAEVGMGRNDAVALKPPRAPAADTTAQLTALDPKARDLTDAIASAEALGGNAVDSGVVPQGGTSAYRVDIVADGRLTTVAVDPTSNKATAAPTSNQTPPTQRSAPAPPAR